MDILAACRHPKIFAPWFRKPETYEAWFAFLAALFALPMTEEQTTIYRRHTGRSEPPAQPHDEATLVVGRRGGKSLIMALVGVYLGCFFEYRQYLAPGERATVLIVAADRRQARVILRYIRAMLTQIDALKKMVERETNESFDLSNSVTIEVGTASFRSSRGYTFAAVLGDEIAFWPTDDSANPDFEILDAIRPGMATIPNAKLIKGSSPYARRGVLWDDYKRFYGKDNAPLVWQADTQSMNPTVPKSVIDRAVERDPASAAAEYGAQFRTDVETLLTREVVEAAIDLGTVERPRMPGVQYVAFVDPSGGSADSMTLAIGHKEGDVAMIDVVRERKPPFSPEAVTSEFADAMKAYGIHEVTGDRYAGEWPRERFKVHGITYRLAEKPASELFGAMLPALNSRRVALVDNPRLTAQLVALERRTSRAGRDLISHPPGGHDDIANSVAGAIHLLNSKGAPLVFSDAFRRRAAMPPQLRLTGSFQ